MNAFFEDTVHHPSLKGDLFMSKNHAFHSQTREDPNEFGRSSNVSVAGIASGPTPRPRLTVQKANAISLLFITMSSFLRDRN